MTSRAKNILIQVVGVAIATGLLYLALRNVDFGGMWRALAAANYWWLVPIVVVTMLSHFLRAWRWRMFLDALPETESTGDGGRPSLTVAFNAVMIGYLLNIVVPRLGEVARAANLSSQANLRFSSVFGTVVVERLLDLVVLIIVLIWVGFVIAGSSAAEAIFFGPLRERMGKLTASDILLVLLAVVVAVGLLIWLPGFLSRRNNGVGLQAKLTPILRSFRSGLVTLFTSPHRIGIIITTVGIWFFYWTMLYLPIHMLHMAEPYGLNPTTVLVLLGMGSIGFVLPAPGGIGAYHYFVIETLVQIYAVPYEVAAGFAVLTHTAQIVLITIVGFGCLLAQGSSLGSLLRSAQDAKSVADEASPS